MSSLAVARLKPGTQKKRAVGFALLRSRNTIGVEETEFERFVREHEIPEILWGQSIAVREWAKKNAERRYVPEHILAAFNITVKSTYSDWAEKGL